VSYDQLLARVARERGLLESCTSEGKRKLRDRIRQLDNGEVAWQKCQAQLYGPRIGEASLIPGVPEFFGLCRERGIQVQIVSHKTEFSAYDASQTNLRTAALQWMASHGFFDPKGLGLTTDDVFFASTRQEKINRIAQIGCSVFIDDLEETFLEASFPRMTTRILYEPGRDVPAPPGVVWMSNWQEITEYCFGS